MDFEGDISFAEATFHGNADFVGTTFGGRASFEEATFKQALWLAGARFSSDAEFAECRFEQEVTAQRFVVAGTLDLHRTAFDEGARIHVAAERINGSEARFADSLALTVEWAEIDLGGAAFGAPSVIRSISGDSDGEVARRSMGVDHALESERIRRATRTSRARIVSLRDASVAQLTLSGLDLRACLFAGAHNLDQLRLESGTVFATNPRGDRQALAEEHAYRAERARRSRLRRGLARLRGRTQPRSRWQPPATLPPPLLDPAPTPLDAGAVAAIYRALRKGREDHKDEPGAADFYYGEMEMRRRARTVSSTGVRGRLSLWAERVILWIYWLTSGYGLRSGRAVIGLVVLLVAFTPLFHLYGFRDRERPFATAAQIEAAHAHERVKGSPQAPFPPPLRDVGDGLASGEAWNYTAGTATALIGAPDSQLTEEGRAFRIVLRLLGPLFIGLALLSIRGRIKR